MKAYDVQEKKEIEVTADDLVKFIDANRQVDLVFAEPRTDADGYLTWDRENWLLVKEGKYHNIYDLRNSFFPEEAIKIEIN